MEIKGIEILPEKSGQSANGEWRKQEHIFETDTSYPKRFALWPGRQDWEFNRTCENVEVSVDLESREYNGRWYTDVKGEGFQRRRGVTTHMQIEAKIIVK